MFETKHNGRRQYLLCVIMSALCAASMNVKSVIAEPMDMTAEKLLDICTSSTVQIAGTKGDVLGWQKMTDAERDELRSTLGNPSSTEIVGWRRSGTGRPEFLWFATHAARVMTCWYTKPDATGLFESLSKHLGSPDELDRNDAANSITALWLQNELEYSFVQLRSSAIVTIGSQR
ncbi:hypothetical protein LQT97_24075 [Brucella pseudogrignonensis]|uniref:hypothetical protein n=1 Tax=Brucella pseudogrignonensis TaxID=419475 RepID=UPI001E481F46|nr:hypothetical protein [Brucella pseudogrignonensis]MCD4514312.1 hypothetical protein [Brucella pseudogrignonensis]